MLDHSFIVPYMIYGVDIWGNTYKTNTNSIFFTAKKAIRIISKKPYHEPTHSVFIHHNITKFQN